MRVDDTVPVYVFPDPDLMLTLVTLYFTHYNSYLPLLHRPTFEKAMADGEHWTDHLYAGTLLLVCALGARHSNDPRIFSTQPGGTEAGWRYFEQLTSFQTALQDRTSTTLYELQIHCVRCFQGPRLRSLNSSFLAVGHISPGSRALGNRSDSNWSGDTDGATGWGTCSQEPTS